MAQGLITRQILLICCFLGIFNPLVLGVSVEAIFKVKSGKNKGGCDAIQNTLQSWYQESIELAKAGLQCFEDAEDKGTIRHKVASDNLKLFLDVNSGSD